jgi:hypothetical protein
VQVKPCVMLGAGEQWQFTLDDGWRVIRNDPT